MGNNRKQLDQLWGVSSGTGNQRSASSSAVDDSYVNQFITDANSYMDTIDGIIKGINYKTAKGTSFVQSRVTDDLQERAKNVLTYLDENQGRYDINEYKTLRSQIENFQGVAAEGKKAVQSARDYYSQWDTEDAYNRDVQRSSWAQKYQGKGYQELVPLLESMEDGEEKQWLTDYAGAVDYNERANLDLDAADKEIQNMAAKLRAAKTLELEYDSFRENPLLMLTQGDTWRDLESRYDALQQEHGGAKGLATKLNEKRRYMAESKQLQDSIRAGAEQEAWKQTVRDEDTIIRDLDTVEQLMVGHEDDIRRSNQGSAQQDMERRQESTAGKEVLQQKKAELEKELQYRRMMNYAALVQQPDFEKYSKYIPTGEGNAVRDNATGMYVDTGFRDIEYDYINKNEKASTYQTTIDSLSNLNRMGMDRKWLLQMTDDEVAVYNYLYHKEGKTAAGEYLDVMRSTLNQRQRAAEQAQWVETAKAHPVLASGASVLISPLKAAGFVGQAIDYAADGKIDQNAAYNRASYISTAIRDQVAQQIRNSGKWGAVGSFGYQTAMSMGDFLLSAAIGGGTAGVATAILGSGAAADTVIRSKDKGLKDNEAFALGTVAGLAEALTERFSMDALFDVDMLRSGIPKYVLTNTLTEGSEEAASSIINLFADILITKEKSEWQQAIRSYQDQGYSEGEAFGKAMADQAAAIGLDTLGGMLSGFALSGATGAQYHASTTKTGRALGRRGLTDTQQVQQILDAGANAEKGSAANAVAGRLQKKIDAGGQLTTFDKGQLYQSNPEAVGEAVFSQGSVQLADALVRGIDNKSEDWKQAQRLASITGRDIRFYNGDPNEDGQYDPRTGEIYINVDRASEHQISFVFAHELTHSTELGESYQELLTYVRGKVKAEGRDWDLMKRNKAEQYANAGHALEKESDVEAELIAQYVQENLLTNEQELYDLFWEEPTIGQKVLNWFDRILAKYGKNDKAKDRVFIYEARQRVLKAKEDADRARQGRKQKPAQPEQKQHIEAPTNIQEYRQWIDQEYEAGRYTEEEYDQMLNALEQDEAEEIGRAELGRQYSFAGEKSKTADLSKLQMAKTMQAQGVDNETIRQQTGWFQGMDRKWRYEIDDSDFRVDRHGDARGAVSYKWALEDLESARDHLFGSADLATLNDVRAYNRACIAEDTAEMDRLYEKLIHGHHAYWFGIYADAKIRARDMRREYGGVLHSGDRLADFVQHDALFEAYPQLREASFRFAWLPDGTRGQYDPSTNTITINDEIKDAPERTILHEIQHAIQKTEGFASGSSPEYWQARQKTGETFGVNDKQIDEQMQHAQEILDSVPEEVAEQFRDWYDLNNRDENAGIIRAQELADGEYGDQFNDYFMTTWSLEELQKYNHGRGINDLYRNTAGEIEARDTANRWKVGLDEEGRKETPPDLGDEKTVFVETGRWISALDEEYADRQNYVDADISNEETEAGIREVAQMAAVTQITGNEFAKGDVDLITQVEQFFAQENNEAHNPQIGTVILDRKGVKSDIAHGIGRKKAAAFAAVPDVIEKGRVVDYQKNWKNRGYDTAVIAAPIQIGQEEHISAIIAIRSRNTNLFYVHEVLTTKNGAMPFKTGARKSGVPSGDAPSIFSILNRIVEVKANGADISEKNQFSLAGASTLNKRDVARDLRAILSRGGDPKELQRYVDRLERNSRNAEQNGKNRYQTGEKRNSTAREIMQAAHRQGQSVEEYLRWNPEEFEVAGRWRPEALEAMRMEQGGRRYSLNTESEGSETDTNIQEENAESQAREIRRDTMPSKARNYLARVESKLLNSIGDALQVPRYARYKNLQSIIQEISDAYLAQGTIPEEKMQELFDKAYAEGIVTDYTFFEQYKEIKKHLQTYGLTLSEQDRSDIADFEDFRRRAFGTLRILNEGGVPVDTAYQELRTMAPELFPESITHPADQLVKMYEVGQSIAVSQKSLDEYYGPEREQFRSWARGRFDQAFGEAVRDLKDVIRYSEDHADLQEQDKNTKRILTAEEAAKEFEVKKILSREVDKARAKNLLSESDEILLGRMLKGEIGEQHLDPNKDNVKGIMAMYKAKLAYEEQCELLTAYRRSVRAKRLQEADRLLETARSWKDKRAGILYARETMRRNIMDIVPDKKLAGEIADFYFEAVHISEAKATKFKNDYRDRVRALKLDTKVRKGNLVSEAHAVQLLGEAIDNIRVMEKARGRMFKRDGKTLDEWRDVVNELWSNNMNLDRPKVERAVEEFRKIYDELFQQMNQVRVENGYEPVNYRQGYFPHFQPDGDGIMGYFGKVLGINTQVDVLPTTINGLTHTFKPGIQWFGNAQERIGYNTAYDAVEGFDRYIEGVASVIFQTENIQKLRALATQVRYRTTDEGIRKQVDAVRMDGRLTEEEKQREINAIYEHGRFSLSNFVAELDEYTNLLANKKSRYDRTMEALIGRRAYTIMKEWENRVGANMIAGNISSALTNFIPLTQAGAQLDSGMVLRGMRDTLRNMRTDDGLAGMSDFLTNRRGSDPLVQTWVQKTSGVLGTPMQLIDNFTSESIVRAAYLQNRKRGLSENEAMHQADIFASGVMADRSKGSMPTLFESRNPLFKAFTQFQLEVNNQFSEVFKDLPRNHREKGLAALALILLKYFLGAWLYNELFEKVIGRRSALDPIGILLETSEDLTGYEIPNLFDMVFEGDRIEKTGEGSIGEAGTNLATNILSELPFSAGLTMFGIETDGGRLPAASAVIDLSALWEAATEKGWSGAQRWKQIQDELNKLAYVVPPFAGGQISKTWKGVKAYLEGGSYSLNQKGEEILQYPVYKDDPDDAFWSLVRAAFLGKNSLPEAQEWVESGFDSLNALETATYQDMLEVGVKDRDAFAAVDALRSIEESEDGAKRAQRIRLLANSNISPEGKAVAYYGLVATETEREWMDALAEAGADQADTMVFVTNLYDAENLKGTEKKDAQLRAFLDTEALTEDEKKIAVGFILGTDLQYENGNPTQYAKFLTAMETGLSVDKYMEIRAIETDIEDYLELTDVGIKGEKAADLAISIDALEPTEGYDSVTWIQMSRTIMESDLTEPEQIAALETVMYESTFEKVKIGHNFGMNVKSYIDLKSVMPQFDANGNGSYSQQETEDAINALAGDDNVLFALTGTTPNGYNLSDREKAILWQLQNKSWNPKRNPFDREVGQMVYDFLTAEDPAEAAATAESGEAFDIANLLSKMS